MSLFLGSLVHSFVFPSLFQYHVAVITAGVEYVSKSGNGSPPVLSFFSKMFWHFRFPWFSAKWLLYLLMYLPSPEIVISSYGFYLLYKVVLFPSEGYTNFYGEVCGQGFYQILFVWKCLISLIVPSKMKDNFAGYRILSWRHSSFGSLNIPSHSLQISKVSHMKLPGNLPEDPLHMITPFSLAAFKILS